MHLPLQVVVRATVLRVGSQRRRAGGLLTERQVAGDGSSLNRGQHGDRHRVRGVGAGWVGVVVGDIVSVLGRTYSRDARGVGGAYLARDADPCGAVVHLPLQVVVCAAVLRVSRQRGGAGGLLAKCQVARDGSCLNRGQHRNSHRVRGVGAGGVGDGISYHHTVLRSAYRGDAGIICDRLLGGYVLPCAGRCVVGLPLVVVCAGSVLRVGGQRGGAGGLLAERQVARDGVSRDGCVNRDSGYQYGVAVAAVAHLDAVFENTNHIGGRCAALAGFACEFGYSVGCGVLAIPLVGGRIATFRDADQEGCDCCLALAVVIRTRRGRAGLCLRPYLYTGHGHCAITAAVVDSYSICGVAVVVASARGERGCRTTRSRYGSTLRVPLVSGGRCDTFTDGDGQRGRQRILTVGFVNACCYSGEVRMNDHCRYLNSSIAATIVIGNFHLVLERARGGCDWFVGHGRATVGVAYFAPGGAVV